MFCLSSLSLLGSKVSLQPLYRRTLDLARHPSYKSQYERKLLRNFILISVRPEHHRRIPKGIFSLSAASGSLTQAQSPVDDQCLAGDKIAARDQAEYRPGDFIGGRNALQRISCGCL